jgi:hypothetical protein
VKDEDGTDADEEPTNPKNLATKTTTRPVASKTTGPYQQDALYWAIAYAPRLNKKESVRLVSTPNANGNGGNKPVT